MIQNMDRTAELSYLEQVEMERKEIGARNPDLLPRLQVLALLQDSFRCRRCGRCCREQRLTISAKELREIAAFLGKGIRETRTEYTDGRENGRLVVKRPGGQCIFLQEKEGTAACAIYPARPTPCRQFPFFTARNIARDGKDVQVNVTACPEVLSHMGRVMAAARCISMAPIAAARLPGKQGDGRTEGEA